MRRSSRSRVVQSNSGRPPYSTGTSSGPTASSLEPDYCPPIPQQWQNYAWIDNYISAFGLYHIEATNVCLSKAQAYFNPLTLYDSANEMHGYAWTWYSGSVANAGDSLMGFTNSFERAALNPGANFPPSFASLNAGDGFIQDPAAL